MKNNTSKTQNNASQTKPWYFYSTDSLDVLDSKVTVFNTIQSYEESDVKILIDCLSNLGVNTYYFSHCANEIAPNLTPEAIIILKNLLSNIRMTLPAKLSSNDRINAFCEFYLLTYYYFRDEQNEEMTELLHNYEQYFTDSVYEKETALIYQIKGRYYRSKGNIEEAIKNDEKAIHLLDEQKIDNIQVQISYAATLIRALQNTADVSYIGKVYSIIPKVETAIKRYPNVSRYYYLLAKLYLYTLLYDDNLDADKYNTNMHISRSMIEIAIDKENPQLKAYVKNVSKYNGLRQAAEFMLIQRKFIDQTRNTLNKKVELSEAKIQDTLQKTQNRYLEMLGLFVSIIAIIMAFIQSFSAEYDLYEMVTIIIVMNAGLLTVYATFLILLRKYQAKYGWVIFICMMIILATSVICHRTQITRSTYFDNQASVPAQNDISSNQSTIPSSP